MIGMDAITFKKNSRNKVHACHLSYYSNIKCHVRYNIQENIVTFLRCKMIQFSKLLVLAIFKINIYSHIMHH